MMSWSRSGGTATAMTTRWRTRPSPKARTHAWFALQIGNSTVAKLCSNLLCADVFLERVSRFRAWLAARPERVIAVVSHWGVLDALTQVEFANCEVRPARRPSMPRGIMSCMSCSRCDARASPSQLAP